MLVHLNLGYAFRESMSVSPMDLDVGDNLILSWDWISSHDLRHLYQAGPRQVDLRSGSAQLQLALLPPAARPPPANLSTVIGHGEFRRAGAGSCARSSATTPLRALPLPPLRALPPPRYRRCRRRAWAARTSGRRVGRARDYYTKTPNRLPNFHLIGTKSCLSAIWPKSRGFCPERFSSLRTAPESRTFSRSI